MGLNSVLLQATSQELRLVVVRYSSLDVDREHNEFRFIGQVYLFNYDFAYLRLRPQFNLV